MPLLHLFWNLRSTLPVDKIFAFSGLADDIGVRPDYTIQEAGIFLETTKAMIKHSGTLYDLTMIPCAPLQDLGSEKELSWVRYWNVRNTSPERKPLLSKSSLYHADRDMPLSISASQDMAVLSVHRIEV